jgi:hypothetical protein
MKGRYSKIVCTQWYVIATHDSRILICESDVHGCWIEAFLIRVIDLIVINKLEMSTNFFDLVLFTIL